MFRAGAGLFYDRFPLAFLNDAIQKDGSWRLRAICRGCRIGAPLCAFSGRIVRVSDILASTHSTYRPQSAFASNSTYARKFTAGIERALNTETTLTVEYMNIAGSIASAQERRPDPAAAIFARTERQFAIPRSQRKFASSSHKELTYRVAYTAGAAYDDASDFNEQPLNPANTRLDWSRSRQYQAHRVVASSLFELPLDEMGGTTVVTKGRQETVPLLQSFLSGALDR